MFRSGLTQKGFGGEHSTQPRTQHPMFPVDLLLLSLKEVLHWQELSFNLSSQSMYQLK